MKVYLIGILTGLIGLTSNGQTIISSNENFETLKRKCIDLKGPIEKLSIRECIDFQWDSSFFSNLSINLLEIQSIKNIQLPKWLKVNHVILEQCDLSSFDLSIIPISLRSISLIGNTEINLMNSNKTQENFQLNKIIINGSDLKFFDFSVLKSFSKMETIDLANNKIDSITGDLRNCESLVTLNLNNNRLRDFNDSILNSGTLQYLFLSGNQMKTVSVGNSCVIKCLKKLDLTLNYEIEEIMIKPSIIFIECLYTDANLSKINYQLNRGLKQFKIGYGDEPKYKQIFNGLNELEISFLEAVLDLSSTKLKRLKINHFSNVNCLKSTLLSIPKKYRKKMSIKVNFKNDVNGEINSFLKTEFRGL